MKGCERGRVERSERSRRRARRRASRAATCVRALGSAGRLLPRNRDASTDDAGTATDLVLPWIDEPSRPLPATPAHHSGLALLNHAGRPAPSSSLKPFPRSFSSPPPRSRPRTSRVLSGVAPSSTSPSRPRARRACVQRRPRTLHHRLDGRCRKLMLHSDAADANTASESWTEMQRAVVHCRKTDMRQLSGDSICYRPNCLHSTALGVPSTCTGYKSPG